MTKIFYQKVAACSKDGSLKIQDKEELNIYLNNLFKIPKSINKMEELLHIGKVCMDEGYETTALKIYQNAYHSLSSLECSKEAKLKYAQTVLYALSALNSSDNEYVWESTGEFIHACRDFIEKLNVL